MKVKVIKGDITKLDCDAIVNAAVTGDKAAEQLRICSVDNGVTAQGGNIPPPEIHALPHRTEIFQVRHTLLPDFLLQISILHRQKFFSDGPRHPDIEQRTEQALLLLLAGWDFHFRILRLLFQQFSDQICSPF